MSERTTPKATLEGVIQVVCKRKFQILLVVGVTLCIALIGIRNAETFYQASAKLLIKVPRQNLESSSLTGNIPVIKVDRESQINTEIQILKSQYVAAKVVEAIGPTVIYKELSDTESSGQLRRESSQTEGSTKSIVQEAAEKIQQDTSIEAIRLTNVMKVKFKHTDPTKAALVLNMLVKVYLDHHLEVHKTPQSHEFFQQQTSVMKSKLHQSEERLQAFKRKNHIMSFAEQRSLLLEKESAIQTELSNTRSQIVEAEMRIVGLQEQLAATPKTIGLNDSNPPAFNNLYSRLVELEIEERELLQKYTIQHPHVISVRNNIKKMKDELGRTEVYHNIRSQLNPIYQTLQQEYLRNRTEMKVLEAKSRKQAALLDKYRHELQMIRQVESDYNLLKEEVEFARKTYRLYLDKLEEVRVSNAMDVEKIVGVSLIQPAESPIEPMGSKKRMIGVMAFVIGGFGGFGLAFVLEYFDDRIEKVEDVENYVDLPVLGTISEIPS